MKLADMNSPAGSFAAGSGAANSVDCVADRAPSRPFAAAAPLGSAWPSVRAQLSALEGLFAFASLRPRTSAMLLASVAPFLPGRPVDPERPFAPDRSFASASLV